MLLKIIAYIVKYVLQFSVKRVKLRNFGKMLRFREHFAEAHLDILGQYYSTLWLSTEDLFLLNSTQVY